MGRPSKKVKLNKPAEDSNPSEPKKQLPEASHPTAEATIDDPPPEEHDVTMDHIDVEPVITKPSSPIKPTEEKTDDVVITGLGYTAPGNPTALSKHSAKEEFSVVDKGKWKVDLDRYA